MHVYLAVSDFQFGYVTTLKLPNLQYGFSFSSWLGPWLGRVRDFHFFDVTALKKGCHFWEKEVKCQLCFQSCFQPSDSNNDIILCL